LVKRYVAEPGSDHLRELMGRAEGWFICRVGFLETGRAIGLAGSRSAVRALHTEWPAFGVIEIDQGLVEKAMELALAHELRSLDALHLAAALVLPREDLTMAVWDRRLHAAARAEGLAVFPDMLEGRVVT
jgi:predicted nucleic acid-binding protein